MNDKCIACGATPISDIGLQMERKGVQFGLPICQECLTAANKVYVTIPSGPSRNEKYLGEVIAAIREERGLPPLRQ